MWHANVHFRVRLWGALRSLEGPWGAGGGALWPGAAGPWNRGAVGEWAVTGVGGCWGVDPEVLGRCVCVGWGG